MLNEIYKLRFLETFEEDLNNTIDYIRYNLKNPKAANNLIDALETAILERLKCPLAFEPYISKKERKHTYYRIYVSNYIVFYVVIGDTMEIRRLLHKSREHNVMV